MTKKILRYTALSGIFLIPLIPFLVSTSMFFPFITGKNFAFRIIVELIAAAWAILMLISPEYRPKRSWISICMVVFLGVLTIADLFGVNPIRSFWSNFERMEGLLSLIHLALYLFVLGTVLQKEKLWTAFWNTSIGASVAMCIYGFTQLGGFSALHQGTTRVDATLGNPTYLAVYILFHIFITLLFLYRSRQNKKLSLAYLVAIAMQLSILFYTGTRGTILGLVGGLILAALIVLIKGKAYPTMRKYAGISIGAVVLLTLLFFGIRGTDFVKNSQTLSRLANISLQDATVQSRFLLWTRIGWEGFKERPILGWGQDNFIVVFGKYYDPLMYRQEPWFDRAHNVFVDWLIAGGILGLLSYLCLFAAGVIMLWRSTFPLPEKSLLIGLFAAYFFHNIFVFDNLVSYIYFATILAWIHSAVVYEGKKDVIAQENFSLPVALGGGAVITITFFFSLWFFNIQFINRSQTLLQALSLEYSRSDYQSILATYDQALAYGPGLGREEVREQLVQSAVRVAQQDVPQATKDLVAQKAITELTDSVANDPGNTRPLFFLAYVYSRTGMYDQALKTFADTLAINSTRQNFLYEVARVYTSEKDMDNVIKTYKQAYEVAPENDTAFGYYGGSLILAGREAEGEKLLIERFGTTTVDNDVVLKAYDTIHRYDKIIDILNLRIANFEPPYDDAQTHASLAFAYLNMGNKTKAIEELGKAGAIDPSFAPQANQIIEAIKAGKNIRLKK